MQIFYSCLAKLQKLCYKVKKYLGEFMKIIDVDKSSKYINKIQDIYFESFPENERIPFEEIVNREFPNSKLLGFIDEDNIVGFTYVSVSDEFVYFIFGY